MKHLLATLVAIAFGMPLCQAQLNRDTLWIRDENSEVQVLIFTSSLARYGRYANPDSLKRLLVNDVSNARQQNSYDNEAQVVHYFLSANGKRRLKAEGRDFTEAELNVNQEKFEMDAGLPPARYIIHDFVRNDEYRFYLKAPGNIYLLQSIDLQVVKDSLAATKELKSATMAEVKYNKGSASVKRNTRKMDVLEIGIHAGAGIIGSKLAPMFGSEWYLNFTDRYAVPQYKLGLSFRGYFLATVNNDNNKLSFTDVGGVGALQLKWFANYSRLSRGSGSSTWLGVQAGVLGLSTDKGVFGGKTAFTTGFSVITGKFESSFDIIVTGLRDRSTGMFTVGYSF